MRVTAAIISWNTRDLLLRCLRSLAEQVREGTVEAWVLDNGSVDESAAAARAEAPWAHVLESEHNLGFGPAVNRIARATTSEWLLAANADVALEDGALEELLRAGSDPRVGCVAPRLLLPDGATQHSVYPYPTIPFTAAFNLGLHRLSPRIADGLCLEGSWDPERPRVVPWAIGACLLLRRSAFEAVGGFDDQRWMYAEDLDLGWRLRRQGFLTWYEPRARVLHASGAATAAAFGENRAPRFMTATYLTLLRRRGRSRMLVTAVLNVLGAAVRMVWMTPPAAVSKRWRTARRENRRWLHAHLHALRAVSTLARPK